MIGTNDYGHGRNYTKGRGMHGKAQSKTSSDMAYLLETYKTSIKTNPVHFTSYPSGIQLTKDFSN